MGHKWAKNGRKMDSKWAKNELKMDPICTVNIIKKSMEFRKRGTAPSKNNTTCDCKKNNEISNYELAKIRHSTSQASKIFCMNHKKMLKIPAYHSFFSQSKSEIWLVRSKTSLHKYNSSTSFGFVMISSWLETFHFLLFSWFCHFT